MLTPVIDTSKEYGLVLEGGGAKGAYQIGAWKALKEAGVKINAVAGTHPFARGCGLMIIPLRVLRASSVLKIAVEVGLVVGITAAMTPSGSAIFFVPYTVFSSITPQVFVFL